MRKSLKLKLIVFAVVIACISVSIIIETQTKIIRRALDNYVYDNRNHYLSCSELPTESEVRKILEEHPDVIHRIDQVDPGFVGVDVDSITCPGRADLLIWYASHQDRTAIEGIINSDTYFGVPYRLQNR